MKLISLISLIGFVSIVKCSSSIEEFEEGGGEDAGGK